MPYSVKKSVKCRVPVWGRGPTAFGTEWVKISLSRIVMKVKLNTFLEILHLNFLMYFMLDIARNYLLPVSVLLFLLSVHVTIILTNLTALTDRKLMPTVNIHQSRLPLITLTTNPSLPLSFIPHPYAIIHIRLFLLRLILLLTTNPSSTLLFILHPHVIADVAANGKLKQTDTGDVTTTIFNLTPTLS